MYLYTLNWFSRILASFVAFSHITALLIEIGSGMLDGFTVYVIYGISYTVYKILKMNVQINENQTLNLGHNRVYYAHIHQDLYILFHEKTLLGHFFLHCQIDVL